MAKLAIDFVRNVVRKYNNQEISIGKATELLNDEVNRPEGVKETSFYFGAKVKFRMQNRLHASLGDKEFCLIGFNDSAFSLIEWERRGEYYFEFYTGKIEEALEIVE